MRERDTRGEKEQRQTQEMGNAERIHLSPSVASAIHTETSALLRQNATSHALSPHAAPDTPQYDENPVRSKKERYDRRTDICA